MCESFVSLSNWLFKNIYIFAFIFFNNIELEQAHLCYNNKSLKSQWLSISKVYFINLNVSQDILFLGWLRGPSLFHYLSTPILQTLGLLAHVRGQREYEILQNALWLALEIVYITSPHKLSIRTESHFSPDCFPFVRGAENEGFYRLREKKDNFLFIWEENRRNRQGREWESMPMYCFASQMLAKPRPELSPKPGHSTCIFHMGARNPITWAISTASEGHH